MNKSSLEDLGLEDEDSQLTLTWEQIMRIWRIDNLPKLDDELTEFLKYVAMRHSANLQEIRYADWVTAFNEDYCIQSTPHDLDEPFNYFDEKPDADDIVEEIQQIDQSTGDKNNVEDLDNDDFIVLLDQALGQILSVLPDDHPKTALLDILMPYVNALDE